MVHSRLCAMVAHTEYYNSVLEVTGIGWLKFNQQGSIKDSYQMNFKAGPVSYGGLLRSYLGDFNASSEIKSKCYNESLVVYNLPPVVQALNFNRDTVRWLEIIDVYEMLDKKFPTLKEACASFGMDTSVLPDLSRFKKDPLRFPAIGDAYYLMKLLFCVMAKKYDESNMLKLDFKAPEPRKAPEPKVVEKPKVEKPVLNLPEKTKEVIRGPVTVNVTIEYPKDKPSLLANGDLIIPFTCDPKYHWWANPPGMMPEETLAELMATK